ncbi:myosin light chain kinase, smooth muscle-like isoform X1 [Agelaius phoeniceus]|uniref:myosin light chain kinase, smooth muscle-like isoform X1 n=1 Tax=Agelaius phoeniceus TaxID=39638 RepID=UPI004055175C
MDGEPTAPGDKGGAMLPECWVCVLHWGFSSLGLVDPKGVPSVEGPQHLVVPTVAGGDGSLCHGVLVGWMGNPQLLEIRVERCSHSAGSGFSTGVSPLGAGETPKCPQHLAVPSVAGGELFERIVDDDFEHTEPSSAQYMQQILEGLQFMHGQAIVHLDLKPENIVCVSPGSHHVKIIDFGLARRLAPDTPVKVLHGTPEFMAPEVVAFEPVSFSTDMWSVGVICYILLSGESPFQGDTDMETLSNVTAARWGFEEETFSEISQQAKDFISQLLQKEPSRRLPSAGALLHPWLQHPQPSSPKALSKERIRQFLARRKWQKTGKALLALKRLTLLSQSPEGKASEALDEEGLEEDQPSRALPIRGANPSELLPDQEEEEEEDGGSTAASGQ